MSPEQKEAVFELARRIAEVVGRDFLMGRVEINIFRGGVGSINVRETLTLKQFNHEQGRETR